MGEMVSCAFCNGNGSDRYKNEPCRACGGAGKMLVPYDNYVSCAFCNGNGSDRYKNEPCRSCRGAGVTAPGLQNL